MDQPYTGEHPIATGDSLIRMGERIASSRLTDTAIQALADLRRGPEGRNAMASALARALLASEIDAAQGLIRRLRDAGVRLETLVDSTIPEAARTLGALWCEDNASFAQVTIAMARLTEIYRGLRLDFLRGSAPAHGDARALFVLPEGEDHAFGVVLAADQFQRAGWSVSVALHPSTAALGQLAGRLSPIGVIGVSVGTTRSIARARAILDLLAPALRPAGQRVIGGALASDPDILAETGADAAIADAAQAVLNGLCPISAGGRPLGPGAAVPDTAGG